MAEKTSMESSDEVAERGERKKGVHGSPRTQPLALTLDAHVSAPSSESHRYPVYPQSLDIIRVLERVNERQRLL